VILAIGLDLCTVSRLKAAASRRPRLLDRLFTDGERAAAGRRQDPWPSLAARFAAKEAALKALGTGWRGGIGWRDVEVTGGAGRPPGLRFHGKALTRAEALGARGALVSLTHEGDTAAAVVLLLGQC